MPGAAYDALASKKQQLIRKARKGSVFVAPTTAPHVTALTDSVSKLLAPLPTGYRDLGWMSDDGAQFSNDIDVADVSSWGSTTPTRTDINSESVELQVTCQETNLWTIGMYAGVDTAGLIGGPTSGELKVVRPLQPVKQAYHVLALAVDENAAGEIYIARYWPNAQVTDKDDQVFSSGDDPLTWSVTMKALPDSALGTPEIRYFGGPGWFSILSDMGIPTA